MCADESKDVKLIVMGEKGRAQLGRSERNSILSTIADTNKVSITFAQVLLGCSAFCLSHLGLLEPSVLSVQTAPSCPRAVRFAGCIPGRGGLED